MERKIDWLGVEEGMRKQILEIFSLQKKSLRERNKKKNIKFVLLKEDVLSVIEPHIVSHELGSVRRVINKLLDIKIILWGKDNIEFINLFSEIDWYKNHDYCHFYFSEQLDIKDLNYLSSNLLNSSPL